jgi:hypothetical protein
VQFGNGKESAANIKHALGEQVTPVTASSAQLFLRCLQLQPRGSNRVRKLRRQFIAPPIFHAAAALKKKQYQSLLNKGPVAESTDAAHTSARNSECTAAILAVSEVLISCLASTTKNAWKRELELLKEMLAEIIASGVDFASMGIDQNAANKALIQLQLRVNAASEEMKSLYVR